jgi:hypothetical protein
MVQDKELHLLSVLQNVRVACYHGNLHKVDISFLAVQLSRRT